MVSFMDINFKVVLEVDPEKRNLGMKAGGHSGHVATSDSLMCVFSLSIFIFIFHVVLVNATQFLIIFFFSHGTACLFNLF